MAHQRTSQTLPQEFYLPSTPPADLTGFALHILSEKRVVGSSLRRHNAIRANLKYDTGLLEIWLLCGCSLTALLAPDMQCTQNPAKSESTPHSQVRNFRTQSQDDTVTLQGIVPHLGRCWPMQEVHLNVWNRVKMLKQGLLNFDR